MEVTFKDFKQRFLRKKVLLILAAMGILFLFVANYSPAISSRYISPPSVVPPEPAKLDNAPRKQVVVRTAPVNGAGLGSVIAQLRSSAAIATMLGGTFATYGVVSTHLTEYRAAEILHIDRLENHLDAGTRICALSASTGHQRIPELVEGWCDAYLNATLADEHASELQGFFRNCDLILDDRDWDVRYEWSKCTWKWVKHIFTNLGLKKRSGGIGLHVRWGDMSVGTPIDDPMSPSRSTPIEKGAEMLRKLRHCGMRDELSVYMEWHNDTMLAGLGEPYRVVDRDSIEDLLDLAANRLLILDIGSWTILAHQIAEGGVSIIPDVDLEGVINWYDNGVNHVLRWHELLSIPCSDLAMLLSA